MKWAKLAEEQKNQRAKANRNYILKQTSHKKLAQIFETKN